jgi:hypothetical protein
MLGGAALLVLTLGLTGAVAGCGAATTTGEAAPRATLTAASRRPARPARCRHRGPHETVDPRTALPLPPSALASATRAAQRYLAVGPGKIRRPHHAMPLKAVPVLAKRNPSAARHLCGKRVAERSVFIHVVFPHAPGAALASAQFLVSRFSRRGYVVWDWLR